MRCNYCGTNVSDGSAFCPNCGGRVDITPQQNSESRNGYNPQPNPYPPQQNNAQNQEGFTLPPDFFEIPQTPMMNNQPSSPAKKKSKSILIAIIIVIAVVIFAGLGIFLIMPLSDGETTDSSESSDVFAAQSDSAVQEAGTTAAGAVTEQPTSETDDTGSGTVSVEQQVIYDKNSIKVTVTSLEADDYSSSKLNLLFENNSGKAIRVTTSPVSINGIMDDSSLSVTLSDGEKTNSSINFTSYILENAHITTIKDIEFILRIFDQDTYNSIIDSSIIKITTTADENYVQTVDDSGIVAYEDENCKVVAKKVPVCDEEPYSNVSFYIENKADEHLFIFAVDTAVNGAMINPTFYVELLPGKKAYRINSFMQEDLKKNSISDITELEVNFEVAQAEPYKTLYQADRVTIQF